MSAPRQCKVCGGPIVGRQYNAITCSEVCRIERRRERHREAFRKYYLANPEKERERIRQQRRRERIAFLAIQELLKPAGNPAVCNTEQEGSVQ
jgi:predicted nucleic acid-binding Zn ribbon protein